MKILFLGLVNCKTKITYYWVTHEPQKVKLEVPILNLEGKIIKYTSKKFFSELQMEGSGVLNDKR